MAPGTSTDTMTYPITSTLDFVNALDLAIPEGLAQFRPGAELVAPPDKKQSANVDAGSTVTFVSDLTTQNKEDVLNSALLAQLSANFKYNRETDTQNWYMWYVTVLENIGWVLQSMQFQHYSTTSSSLTMSKAVLEIMAALASGNELAVLEASLSAFEKLPGDSDQVKLFDSNGSGGNNGNFQLGTASQDPDKNVSLVLGAYYFKATEHQTRFLFWTWESDQIDIYYDTHRIVLNEKVYATVRQAVITKLGDKAKTFVANIPI